MTEITLDGNRKIDFEPIDRARARVALLLFMARRVMMAEPCPGPEDWEAWKNNCDGVLSCGISDIMAMGPKELENITNGLILLIDNHGGVIPVEGEDE